MIGRADQNRARTSQPDYLRDLRAEIDIVGGLQHDLIRQPGSVRQLTDLRQVGAGHGCRRGHG